MSRLPFVKRDVFPREIMLEHVAVAVCYLERSEQSATEYLKNLRASCSLDVIYVL